MSRGTQVRTHLLLQFRLRGYHPLCLNFPVNSAICISSHIVVLQPQGGRNRLGLGFSAFARHYLRNHFCFLFLRVLRCFSSPRLPHFLEMVISLQRLGCPIRISTDQCLFATPRSFSQLITSFFASMSQGIHPSPFSRFLFS